MNRLFMILFYLLLSVSISQARNIDELYLMSEEFPPYNYTENGEIKGTSIDLMDRILQKLHSKQNKNNIHILPWARAYNYLLKRENTVLFAMTRTQNREKLFKWVGPISTARNVLIARKARQIKISSVEDIQKYIVGAVRNDAGAQLLISEAGIQEETISLVSSAIQSIKMLNLDRIDLFAFDENVTAWLIKKNRLNPEDFETVFILQEGLHYFAFHQNTPDLIIENFQKALDEIKTQGEYDKILDRYLK
ncbi:MAG: amino acid ABC transporter substrate-binding protein [Desulfobacterium sp.]|nr:amino acid ABC transporter substrate-binding protein [Desulfobacterium sp.]